MTLYEDWIELFTLIVISHTKGVNLSIANQLSQLESQILASNEINATNETRRAIISTLEQLKKSIAANDFISDTENTPNKTYICQTIDRLKAKFSIEFIFARPNINPSKSISLFALPLDVLLIIFSFLSPEDLVRMTFAAKRSRAIANHPFLWRNLLNRYFSPEERPVEEKTDGVVEVVNSEELKPLAEKKADTVELKSIFIKGYKRVHLGVTPSTKYIYSLVRLNDFYGLMACRKLTTKTLLNEYDLAESPYLIIAQAKGFSQIVRLLLAVLPTDYLKLKCSVRAGVYDRKNFPDLDEAHLHLVDFFSRVFLGDCSSALYHTFPVLLKLLQITIANNDLSSAEKLIYEGGANIYQVIAQAIVIAYNCYNIKFVDMYLRANTSKLEIMKAAIADGNISLIQYIIENFAFSIQILSALLMFASDQLEIEILLLLADVALEKDFPIPPDVLCCLVRAIKDEAEMLRLLDYFITKHHIDINSLRFKSLKDNTLLHVAVQHRNASLVSALLKRGANVDAQNSDGQMPIHLTISHVTVGHPHEAPREGTKINFPIFELLIAAKASVTLENKKVKSFVETIVYQYCMPIDDVIKVFQTLASHKHLDPKHPRCKQAFIDFLGQRIFTVEHLKSFLELGFDVNSVGDHGETPIYTILTVQQRIPVVYFFIENEVNLDSLSCSGLNPVQYCEANKLEHSFYSMALNIMRAHIYFKNSIDALRNPPWVTVPFLTKDFSAHLSYAANSNNEYTRTLVVRELHGEQLNFLQKLKLVVYLETNLLDLGLGKELQAFRDKHQFCAPKLR